MIFIYVGIHIQSLEEIITGKRKAGAVELIFIIGTTIVLLIILRLLSREGKK